MSKKIYVQSKVKKDLAQLYNPPKFLSEPLDGGCNMTMKRRSSSWPSDAAMTGEEELEKAKSALYDFLTPRK
jgi:hypothetical protein